VSINRSQRRENERREAAGSGDGDAPDEPLTDAALMAAALNDPNVEEDPDEGVRVPAAPRSRNGRGAATAVAPGRHRVAPRQFLHEVNVELRKVAWPTRAETINYSTVVFVTLAILMALIFALDLVFTHLAGFLFST
jgi:preprotein translocase subunit SecE